MATFQKFKLLIATHCTVAGIPTRSPTTSPVIHLRKKKTLRMLLGGRSLPDDSDEGTSPEMGLSASHKLKDLFESPPPDFGERTSENQVRERLLTTSAMSDGGVRATFRQRLTRRAWRPVLAAIPE